MRFVLILLLFVQCTTQQKEQVYNFPSAGWRISVPAGYVAEDSATLYGKMKTTPVYQQSLDTTEHWLLFVHDTTGWDLTKHFLNAVWRYCPDSSSMQAYLTEQKSKFITNYTAAGILV